MMNNVRKSLVTMLLASLAISIAASSASANALSIDDTDFLWFTDPLTVTMAGDNTSCDVTVRMSLHRAVVLKTPGSLIGNITRVSATNCDVGSSVTVLAETSSSHATFDGWSGTLPNIATISIAAIRWAIRIDPSDLPACLLVTSSEEPLLFIANSNSGQITSVTADSTSEIDLEDEGFLCSIAGDAEFSGTGAAEDGDGAGATIRLI
jgi:hypothetical protein